MGEEEGVRDQDKGEREKGREAGRFRRDRGSGGSGERSSRFRREVQEVQEVQEGGSGGRFRREGGYRQTHPAHLSHKLNVLRY